MDDLLKIINFLKLLNKFRDVKRVIYVKGSDRYENDVEHSYNLAMLSWYIINNSNLKLNLELVLKYCLVHDLVEVYAGDTPIYTKDKEYKNNKEEREAEAAKKISKEFPEFGNLHELIEKYEKKEDPESKFVYALDKLEPALVIYLDDGRTWKELGINIEMIKNEKEKKVEISDVVKKYFGDFLELIEKDKDKLFH